MDFDSADVNLQSERSRVGGRLHTHTCTYIHVSVRVCMCLRSACRVSRVSHVQLHALLLHLDTTSTCLLAHACTYVYRHMDRHTVCTYRSIYLSVSLSISLCNACSSSSVVVQCGNCRRKRCLSYRLLFVALCQGSLKRQFGDRVRGFVSKNSQRPS